MVEILSCWAERIKHNEFFRRRLEDSGSVTFFFLITEGAEAEECLKSALERRLFLVSWYHLTSLAWTSLLVLLISTHHSIVPPLTITHLWARGDHVILACGNVLGKVTWQMEKAQTRKHELDVWVNSSNFSRSNLVTYLLFDSLIYEMKANALFMAPIWRVW